MVKNKYGYRASSPSEIPLRGWWHIVKRVAARSSNDNLSLVAAGVAFYALLAIFPAIAALVSVYAYFSSPTEITAHLSQFITLMPSSTRDIILQQVTAVSQKSQATLSLSAISTLILAVWSSSKGSQALITACNITYHESNKRPFLITLLMRFLFSVGAIMVAVIALLIIGILPVVLNLVGLTQSVDRVIQLISWPFLAVVFNVALACLYRYAPHRREAKWRWVTLGSVCATVLWIIASVGFSFYVAQFASYNETYGSLGGVVIMLMWLYLSAYIIIFGAAFNASIEQQTLCDSTKGEASELGGRGAYVADNLTTGQKNKHAYNTNK